MTRRALVLGGTGMLARCTSTLVADGWRVVLPSRRYEPLADPLNLAGRALWVAADWSDPADLADRAGQALGGPVDLLVAWVHGSARGPVLAAVAPLLAPGAPVVEVHGSTPGPVPDPLLDGHPTQQVVLGFVGEAGRTRWLTHREISDGVLSAVERALACRAPAVHQVGEPRMRVG
ncbi:hypothetical protein [Actinokineospora sp.]|uniref:hypothetical protein n=1 Tax=Actinokineospora sp. TaxID=1872133 RepID=UPI0040379AA1